MQDLRLANSFDAFNNGTHAAVCLDFSCVHSHCPKCSSGLSFTLTAPHTSGLSFTLTAPHVHLVSLLPSLPQVFIWSLFHSHCPTYIWSLFHSHCSKCSSGLSFTLTAPNVHLVSLFSLKRLRKHSGPARLLLYQDWIVQTAWHVIGWAGNFIGRTQKPIGLKWPIWMEVPGKSCFGKTWTSPGQ